MNYSKLNVVLELLNIDLRINLLNYLNLSIPLSLKYGSLIS